MTEQSKYLADHLFGPAVQRSAVDGAMQATLRLMDNLDNEEAKDALNTALDKVIATVEACLFGPSPRLTDEENDLYIELKRKKLVERRSGNMKWLDRVKLSEEEEPIYERLEAKADGRE